MSRSRHQLDAEYDGCCNPACSECGEPCTPKVVDIGIGPYEFQGQKGNDVRLTWASDCCEAEIVEYSDELDVEPEDEDD